MSNIITIEFFDKKDFPPGKWMSEPDLCFWYRELPCLAVRDMSMGIWKGFVGLEEGHPLYEKTMDYIITIPQALDLFRSVHGGLTGAGRLSTKYQSFAKNCWWIGLECSQGDDLMPLVQLDRASSEMAKVIANQTYKDLHFIRRETNKLVKQLIKLK